MSSLDVLCCVSVYVLYYLFEFPAKIVLLATCSDFLCAWVDDEEIISACSIQGMAIRWTNTLILANTLNYCYFTQSPSQTEQIAFVILYRHGTDISIDSTTFFTLYLSLCWILLSSSLKIFGTTTSSSRKFRTCWIIIYHIRRLLEQISNISVVLAMLFRGRSNK